METANDSEEMLLHLQGKGPKLDSTHTYHTTSCHSREDHNMNLPCLKNLKSPMGYNLSLKFLIQCEPMLTITLCLQ
jgi:hypothetical protein